MKHNHTRRRARGALLHRRRPPRRTRENGETDRKAGYRPRSRRLCRWLKLEQGHSPAAGQRLSCRFRPESDNLARGRRDSDGARPQSAGGAGSFGRALVGRRRDHAGRQPRESQSPCLCGRLRPGQRAIHQRGGGGISLRAGSERRGQGRERVSDAAGRGGRNAISRKT